MRARALAILIAGLGACSPSRPAPVRVAGVLVEPAPQIEDRRCQELVETKDWLPCPSAVPNPIAFLDADPGLGVAAEPRDLGRRTFGERVGTLVLDEAPEGFHSDHLVFTYRTGDHRVAVSLHTWDRLGEAERLLSAIVAGLR